MSEKRGKAVKLLDTKLDKKVIKTLTICTVIMLIAILIHDGDHIRQAYNWGYTIPPVALGSESDGVCAAGGHAVSLQEAQEPRQRLSAQSPEFSLRRRFSYFTCAARSPATGAYGIFSYFDLYKGHHL